jgi:hypothetical protein
MDGSINQDRVRDQSIDRDPTKYRPLTVFIIICFFLTLLIVIYKILYNTMPSIATIVTFIILMAISCLLMLLCRPPLDRPTMVVLTTIILLVSYAIMVPETFFYPEYSED